MKNGMWGMSSKNWPENLNANSDFVVQVRFSPTVVEMSPQNYVQTFEEQMAWGRYLTKHSDVLFIKTSNNPKKGTQGFEILA